MTAMLLGLLAAGWSIHRLRTRLALAVHAACHDPLTGLPNRTAARALFDQRATAGQPTMVALLDLTRFKNVNDTHGHQAGDELLIAVAARLSTCTARHGGHATRLAGDEFLLLTPARYHDPAEPVASILAELTQPVRIGSDPTVSIAPAATAGITVFDGIDGIDGIDGTFTSLLHQADIACYHAKARGTWYERYHPGMTMPTPAQRRGPRLRDHTTGDGGAGVPA
jgi:diguanylate cyclase (GGDEF)-like protein